MGRYLAAILMLVQFCIPHQDQTLCLLGDLREVQAIGLLIALPLHGISCHNYTWPLRAAVGPKCSHDLICTALLAQAFSAWIHICAIRLFVESILRYGLPPKFLPALMKPNQKSTARLRKTLASLFGNAGIADVACIAVVHVPAPACSCCCTAAVSQKVDIFASGLAKSAMLTSEILSCTWLVQAPTSTLTAMIRVHRAWQATQKCIPM